MQKVGIDAKRRLPAFVFRDGDLVFLTRQEMVAMLVGLRRKQVSVQRGVRLFDKYVGK